MDLQSNILKVSETKYKLLLIIGAPGSGKSKLIRTFSQDTGIPIINLDKIFINTAPEQLMNEMKNFLKTYNQHVLLLDNKKILYDKNSTIDLMEFLKEVSLDIPVVATWNGKIEDGQLYHIRKNSEDLIYPVNDEDFKYILC